MKYLLLITSLTFSYNAVSQDYMEKIAIKSCECLDKLSEDEDSQQTKVEVGLCIIEAASPFQKQLKKDHNIDFKKIDEHGEQLGQLVAMKMASVCPTQLIGFAKKINGENESAPKSESLFISGVVTHIEDDIFVILSVKDESGKIVKFYWLSFINSELNLADTYKTLLDKRVNLSYSTTEYFDPRIKEYRPYNVIHMLKPLSN
jgi:hypothetical protein